jgi:uncharacterized hydrophobic protein (TIGR00271 family)
VTLAQKFYKDDTERTPLHELVRGQLIAVGPNRRDQVLTYTILLVLSAVIATGGILNDSTASVIGAMIVAPLGAPIMGIALAVVVGRVRGVVLSIATVAISAAVVIAIGAVIAWVVPSALNYSTNSQITGRVSPNIVDLLTAVATGLVGSYAWSRKDLSTVLPGVAIAISLVPPLAVVGVCLQGSQYADAGGAFLLFLTNVLAMVVAGTAVFALARYNELAHKTQMSRKKAVIVEGVCIVLLAIPLGISTYESLQPDRTVNQATTITTAWLKGTNYVVEGIEQRPGQLLISILGSGILPTTDSLVTQLKDGVGGSLKVRLRILTGSDDVIGTT